MELGTTGNEQRGLELSPFAHLNSNSRSGIDAIRSKNAAPPIMRCQKMRNSLLNPWRLKALIDKSQERRLVPQQRDAIADVASETG